MQRTLLILLVAVSYLLLAGGRPWTLLPILALAAIALLSDPVRTLTFPKEHRTLDVALAVIAAAITLQWLPLPLSVVGAFSPSRTELTAALGFLPMGTPEEWTSLSIHPRRTLEALAAALTGILSFWVSRAVFGASGNTRTFCRVLALLGAVVAIAAVIQKAATPRLLMFVVPPEVRTSNPFGAFTNRNHFAAWLLLITAPSIGYLIARTRIHPGQDRRWRSTLKQLLATGALMTALSAFITTVVLLLTLSRSAVAGLGASALTGWRLGRTRMRVERTTLPARLAAVGVLLIASMVFIDIDGWATRLQTTFTTEGPWGRVTIWKETLPIIRDLWLTGTGAGTYSDAMSHYQQTRRWVDAMQRWAHFNNAHSHYLQVAAEGGLLLAVPALVALGTLWTVARRTLRADKGEMFWVRVGAAAGLAGLAVQSIWEVSLTMPANAVMSGVLAGLLLCRRDGARADATVPFTPKPTRTLS